MNDWRPRTNEDKKEETPPFSRIFVVCSKHFKEEDLRGPFSKFGTIENFYMPKDHHTGESKGVAYIKYSLTSSAAAAIEELHQKCLGDTNKTIKVMVASQKNEKDNRSTNEKKYVRLFIMISPNDTEESIEEHFSTFGDLHSVYIHKNKGKFAYVTYQTFHGAAIAYEQCDRKYKAVFAVPKEELKRGRESFEQNLGSPSLSNSSLNNRDKYHDMSYRDSQPYGRPPLDHANNPQRRVSVTVSPQLHEKYISSLFNIIPGMEDFQYTHDSYNGITKAAITYADYNSAVSAIDRLNNFEFPSGETVSVKWDTNPIAKAATEISLMVDNLKSALDSGTPASGLAQLADCIAQASSLIKVATAGLNDNNESRFCSVKLPPLQPLATTKVVAKRCFIVCKPQPPPLPALKDVFCRFGDMIDVMTFANKTFGFVKYASERAAMDAIKTLHGATVHGATLKVMEADDKQSMTDDNNVDRKRPKMDADPDTL